MSRERDAIIAEKILGCKVGREEDGFPFCNCEDGRHSDYELGRPGLKHYYEPDWAMAGEILEAMAAREYYVEMRNDDGNPCERYRYTDFNGPFGRTTQVDDFGPKAILAAALAALGIEVPA